jgi:hypothetical protein
LHGGPVLLKTGMLKQAVSTCRVSAAGEIDADKKL